jgi:signal transduction histidine kinase/ActR/RegA family two-component response regulator
MRSLAAGEVRQADGRPAPVLVAAVLCLGYVLNLWLTNVLREQAGGVDTIWTANAFVIGAVLLLPRRWTPACLAAGFAIQSAIVFAFSYSAFEALAFSLLNTVEAVVVVTLARRLNAVRLTTPGRFARLIFIALLPMLVVGTLALSLVVMAMSGEFPLAMALSRLAAKFLGMSLMLPAILLLGQRVAPANARTGSWEPFAAVILMVGVGGLISTQFAGLALLGMFPIIAVVGLRLGPRAVTLAMVLIATIVLSTVVLGAPALIASNQTLGGRINMIQLYLAMVFATGLITGLMATHQQRLRAILTNRARSDRRARDRAQAASVSKTDFLATMSHEIRTPLNSIIGFAQVLERTDLPETARQQVGVIRRSGDALLTVVNDILDFSKVEAGRISLDPKPTHLATVCRDALAIVAESAERKGLALDMVVTGPADGAHVCDDHRLCQVLLNFLNNAVKFTDRGGVTLKLDIQAEGPSDRVRIAVVDTGVGIAPDAQPTLFDRFQQVDSSISRTHGGTGLGLAICKGLIEAMGGRVGVSSAPGEGSEFWMDVSLPRAQAQVLSEAEQPGDALPAAQILLVDDHPMNRDLGVAVLAMLGCAVDVACDGLEAVDAARLKRYDAILMDVHMPGLDGLAATRAIRALDGPVSRTPIIAMSADVLPEQVARMQAAGMVDSVEKPISLEALHACLSRWIGRDSDGAEAAA